LLLYLDETAPVAAENMADGLGLTTPRCRDRHGDLPIHALLKANPSVGAVQVLLQAHPSSASKRALNGDYPLMVACDSSASVGVIFEVLMAYPDLIRG